MREQEDNRFEVKWFAKSERLIIRGIAILAVLLLLSQLALHFPAARHLLTHTDHWEGIKYRSP
ncbi:hypothetical protein COLU111180_07895 [Cohnella lubricantis]|uniref:Uncharacterized protein n=1 Tax=Cohnella lubricantis TaxID=2163172 RepID=A0A841T899_9BACL|nr:hypothetical protein [Cohnella lubricantis]MBB6677723.1 hypothetical protein [Cohnella lubricantis]MBP2117685.1 hypothetical protein [Cohnella lubricantis]